MNNFVKIPFVDGLIQHSLFEILKFFDMTGYNSECEKNNILTDKIRVILINWISPVNFPIAVIPKI